MCHDVQQPITSLMTTYPHCFSVKRQVSPSATDIQYKREGGGGLVLGQLSKKKFVVLTHDQELIFLYHIKDRS